MTIKREDLNAGRVDFSDVRDPKARRIPPIHPGTILRDEFLTPLDVSAYRLAKDTGTPITRITAILGGDRAITADTALRFGRFFSMTPEFWLGLQERYDLDIARGELDHRLEKEVRPLAVSVSAATDS
jgi:addiction module HigA family antidote